MHGADPAYGPYPVTIEGLTLTLWRRRPGFALRARRAYGRMRRNQDAPGLKGRARLFMAQMINTGRSFVHDRPAASCRARSACGRARPAMLAGVGAGLSREVGPHHRAVRRR